MRTLNIPCFYFRMDLQDRNNIFKTNGKGVATSYWSAKSPNDKIVKEIDGLYKIMNLDSNIKYVIDIAM